MKLENTFSIPVAVDDAWKILLDVERVAPCVPGATLTGGDGDEHHGTIKVKLGPIGLTYQGTVTFVTRDERAGVVVLEAGGRETRGNGTAKARVTCRLSATGTARTDVRVETELNITGKPAQFGRGPLAEVSAALMDRFADSLATELSLNSAPISRSPADVPPPATEAAPLDLIDATRAGGLKRLAPLVPAAALLLLAALLLRGRRRHHHR
ncbi:SRPBCC family protein [Streptomyces sp. NBS 14/10]|uniref:SRPBCC family protein n=1 Tax=Streptomyces sp. NBS 14/10 TaxID=1945643 RepID=UPI000B7CEED1|nr:SRPBCC family protein [Streptomyces sp. NBS 14/10]KAK1185376.1 SRPBCC family protein [Streptomyces sp. NBS 14/10]